MNVFERRLMRLDFLPLPLFLVLCCVHSSHCCCCRLIPASHAHSHPDCVHSRCPLPYYITPADPYHPHRHPAHLWTDSSCLPYQLLTTSRHVLADDSSIASVRTHLHPHTPDCPSRITLAAMYSIPNLSRPVPCRASVRVQCSSVGLTLHLYPSISHARLLFNQPMRR